MKIVTVPCHFDNYSYVVISEESGEAAVIDPSEYYPVYTALQQVDKRVDSIFCTHHHTDHIGGLEDFRAENKNLKVYGSIEDISRITGLNQPLSDNDVISVGQVEGRVLHTPGHTSGSVCFLFENTLFAGDTVFGAGCGRLFEGGPEQMYSSLRTVVERVPPSCEVYFGHEYTVQNLKFAEFIEPENELVKKRIEAACAQRKNNLLTTPSTLQAELETNPFFRCHVDSVKKSVEEKISAEVASPQQVFAALRRLRDGF